jgi:antitoxin (DNA-binding transcriptional repressor) of toxin-antitoxin stability system
MRNRISATAAARNFSDLLNRVRYRGESFMVERGGKPVCEIIPPQSARFTVADLARLLKTLPQPDKGYRTAVERLIKEQQRVAGSPSRMRKNDEFSVQRYIVEWEVVAGGGGGDARGGPPAERNVQLHIGGAASTEGSSVASHPRDGGLGP